MIIFNIDWLRGENSCSPHPIYTSLLAPSSSPSIGGDHQHALEAEIGTMWMQRSCHVWVMELGLTPPSSARCQTERNGRGAAGSGPNGTPMSWILRRWAWPNEDSSRKWSWVICAFVMLYTLFCMLQTRACFSANIRTICSNDSRLWRKWCIHVANVMFATNVCSMLHRCDDFWTRNTFFCENFIDILIIINGSINNTKKITNRYSDRLVTTADTSSLARANAFGKMQGKIFQWRCKLINEILYVRRLCCKDVQSIITT
jgi:hypothetical protein